MAKKQKQRKSILEDNISKLLLTLLTALILWIFNTTNQTDKVLVSINKDIESNTIHLKKFEEFIKTPRFTKSDFDLNINPIITQLNKNTTELNARNQFIQSTNDKLLKLDFRVKNLEK